MSNGNQFGIQFDFDDWGEDPNVYIANSKGRGTQFLEIFEEPVCKTESWSDDPNDWEAGELAKKLVEFMNSLD